MSTDNISVDRIFIGYDEREIDAFRACRRSIITHSPRPRPRIEALRSQDLTWYQRVKPEPQSTDFTFTRFAVPYLSNYAGWSMFVDCDFIFVSNLSELFSYCDPRYAVMVCKHPYYIPKSAIKMDGIPQHSSPRKNWASLMLFNNAHPACQALTPVEINTHLPGKDFHDFNWVDDDLIGSIPLDWNCLAGYYHLSNPKGIHYTDGGPWFEGYRDCRYNELYDQYAEK